jgi:hypothetical protein
MNDAIERARSASFELVMEMAPAEELSFDGVWSDALAIPDADLNRAMQLEGGSKLVLGGVEIPLLSAVIAPVAIWLAKRVGEKATDVVIDGFLKPVGDRLRNRRNSTAGELSDAEIDRIAARLVTRIAQPKNDRPAD